ncbi:uncharacterized protein LOC130724091 isoform X2 [Lotus japonicus]|uniref:uncharacterized protein LOC130724091 isoform X2 n=1 Tax=Lotus japonicus TaxID=34305 RepID=UPI002584F0D0|nr:uncharacterized protein LOC130724091 isoform X2 [Lotus japonicus]
MHFIYSRGNNLTIVLGAGDLVILPHIRSIFANFKLALINQVNAEKTITAGSEYQFTDAYNYAWPVIPLVELLDSRKGFIMNDTCIIIAEIVHVNEVANPLHQEVCMSSSLAEELVDFKNIGKIEKTFVPYLELECSNHPSLIECHQKRSQKSSRRFTEWAFTALGRVLHFLHTTKADDINADTSSHLQILWEELQSFKTFNFDLTWLEPGVLWSLGWGSYKEKVVQLKTMRKNLATLEMETNSLKEKISTVEVDLTIARRDLEARRRHLEELNSELDSDGELD